MAQDKGEDFQTTALEKLVEVRRDAIESIAKGHGQLEKHISLLTSAQAGIDVLEKEKAEISKSFKNKMTKVVPPEEPQPYWIFNEDKGN
jgi:hypothetical protein